MSFWSAPWTAKLFDFLPFSKDFAKKVFFDFPTFSVTTKLNSWFQRSFLFDRDLCAGDFRAGKPDSESSHVSAVLLSVRFTHVFKLTNRIRGGGFAEKQMLSMWVFLFSETFRSFVRNPVALGCTTFLLLPAALLLFIWSTAANGFELYSWDIAKCQTTQNTFKHKLRIHSVTLCDITSQIITHRVDLISCLAFVLLQNIRQHGAKSYILNYMWTAANFIIEDRRLCTVAVA